MARLARVECFSSEEASLADGSCAQRFSAIEPRAEMVWVSFWTHVLRNIFFCVGYTCAATKTSLSKRVEIQTCDVLRKEHPTRREKVVFVSLLLTR